MRKLILYFSFFISVFQSYGQSKSYTDKQQVKVAKLGILIINISELDAYDNSFHADFYL